MYWLSIAGLIGFGMFLVTTLLDLSEVSPYEEIGSFGLGLAFGMMVLWVIYTSRYMAKIKQFKKKLLNRATESD